MPEYEGIYVKFGANTAEFDNSVRGINKAFGLLRKDVVNLNKQLKLNPDSIEILTQKAENFKQQIKLSEDQVKKLETQISEMDDADIGGDEWAKLTQQIEATKTRIQTLNGSLEATEGRISNIGDASSIYNIDKAIDEVAKDLDIVNRKLELEPGNADLVAKRIGFIGNQSELVKQKIEKLRTEQANLGSANIGTSQWKTYERAINEAEIEAKQLEQAVDRVGNETGDAAKKASTFKDAFKGGIIGGATVSILSGAGNAIGDLGREAITANDSLTKFESTMGFAGFDAAAIATAKQQVKDYADSTVYELGDVANTTAQLAANGIKDYTGLTQAAGNLNAVAGGNADTFKTVGTVLTQTAGAGKLTTENWNQLADAIPGASGILQDAMKKNGAYTGNFREAMEKGEISSEEFNQAMTELGNNDGAKKAAKSTDTFEGAIGNLKANVVSGINDIIDTVGSKNLTSAISGFGEIIEDVLEGLGDLIKWIIENKTEVQALAVAVLTGVAAYKAFMIVQTIMKALEKFKTATEAATVAQKLFNVAMNTNVIAIAVTAIAGLTAGLLALAPELRGANTETGKLREEAQKLDEKVKTLAEDCEKSAEAFDKANRGYEAQTIASKDLATELQNLVEKEDKTIEDKQKILGIVDLLNQSIPNLNLKYDEQTGALSKTTEEIYKYIEAAQKEWQLQALRERGIELAKEEIALEDERRIAEEKRAASESVLADATNRYKTAQNQLNTETARLDEQVRKGNITQAEADRILGGLSGKTSEYWGEVVRAKGAVDENTSAEKRANDALKKNDTQMEDLAIKTGELSGEYDKNTEAVGKVATETGVAVGEAADAIKDAGPQFKEDAGGLIDEVAAGIEEKKEYLRTVAEGVANAIERGLKSAFDAFDALSKKKAPGTSGGGGTPGEGTRKAFGNPSLMRNVMDKAFGSIPVAAITPGGSTTNLNINVTANGSDADNIARVVERQIVRRLNK